MGLEARSAAWDVEREIDREVPSGKASGSSGPRADFLANLGRRVAELSAMFGAFEAEPQSARLRDDLRRRLHALGAGGRLLRFDRLAAEVSAVEELLGHVAERGALTEADAALVRGALGKLAGLGFAANDAASEGGGRPSAQSGGPSAAPQTPEPEAPAWPLSVLVVGPKPMADALISGGGEGAAAMDVERTEDALRAIDLARAVAPDVVIVDADMRGSRELMSAVRKDPLTANVAMIAIGTWSRTEEAAPFLAAGATRAVLKPVSPEGLRRLCREVNGDPTTAAPGVDLGRLTVEELAARLGTELAAAITDGFKAAPETRVEFGRGDDVLGALWAAAGRVRDMVTIKSRGEIRFAPGAAERAVPVGAWMNDASPSKGNVRRGGALSAKSLAGAHILVADDDPAVAWFLSGVLRGEGATVSEACDGNRALRKAMEQSPDVILSDVLMPHIDGLSLTEALRADPLLSDVSVILLSWKEDLLQRARELGAQADAYMRKDASGPAVIQRVRELYYPRARMVERLTAGGEMHGRVDGFTMRTLLKLVCTHRPDCLLEVRDAAYLYGVSVENGRPSQITRTAKDGSFVEDRAALARLLGVRAGRFVVSGNRAAAASSGSMAPSLVEQIRPHAAAARGALHLLSGEAMKSVARVTFDEDWLEGYGALAPEPARALVRRLASGEAPRKILSSTSASGRLFDEVVRDAVGRGAIVGVSGSQGEDLLGPAVASALAQLLGEPLRSVAPPADTEGESIQVDEVSPSGVIVAPTVMAGSGMAPAPSLLASAAADAFAARGVATEMPPSVGASSDGVPVEVEVSAEPGPIVNAPMGPLTTLGSLTPPPIAPRIEPQMAAAPIIKVPRSVRAVEEEDESPAPRRSKKKGEARASETPGAPNVKPPQSRMGVWVMCAVAGIVFAVGARISQDRKASAPPAPQAAPVVTAPAAPALAPSAVSSAASNAPLPAPNVVTVPGEIEADPILPQEAPLRSDEKIPSGQGLLEVVVGPNDEVSIDGRSTVAGPVVKATLAPRDKPYEVKVKMRNNEERVRFAQIKEGKRTRVRIAPPWNH